MCYPAGFMDVPLPCRPQTLLNGSKQVANSFLAVHWSNQQYGMAAIRQRQGSSLHAPRQVVSLEKTNQHFRLLYDTKGRFVIHQIHKDEAAYKLCRVMSHEFGPGGNPYITTHDGRTIRSADFFALAQGQE